jgi:hypothetical protein
LSAIKFQEFRIKPEAEMRICRAWFYGVRYGICGCPATDGLSAEWKCLWKSPLCQPNFLDFRKTRGCMMIFQQASRVETAVVVVAAPRARQGEK